ncbi:23S rRNA (adenine(2503)-C(2))-methyltransferase RlmN [Candidatus Uhrbacteria bacterium]|nr:23S rRNA (adenine(2503)-C(2))-methyltransferase RlmN [Candidatus Uhrbacteria bacterium]
MQTRRQQYQALFPNEPSFRWDQIQKAVFDHRLGGWIAVSTLPSASRAKLEQNLPWMSVAAHTVLKSAHGDTVKAILELSDKKLIESVLMQNRRGQWTICVSSQVGCAMRCAFCATGTMGFIRNLTCDEIVDQYRFWNIYLQQHSFEWASHETMEVDDENEDGSPQGLPTGRKRISNIVFMGMGEPLANYDSVKEAVRTILEFTDIGPTHITVSTVGLLPQLDRLLEDRQWPHVRLAVSLHSADATTRKAIVPTSYDDFLVKLSDWSRRYLKKFDNRRHHLTFEYVLLSGVNDDEKHANKLAKFVNGIGQVKVNLIPYNTTGAQFNRSTQSAAERFVAALHAKHIIATIRKTMGDDIAAACGQLVTNQGDKEMKR